MPSEKIEFPGAAGHRLAARLDRPDAEPAGYALFAHCFTCSKDVFAAARVARGLADRGVAVLRFDFTGLGHSEGEFANTDFSSNVADLVAAADFLRRRFAAPRLLVGHSLGGAAVLAAAGRIPEARAVATIGAPAEPAHVSRRSRPLARPSWSSAAAGSASASSSWTTSPGTACARRSATSGGPARR
jgi:putative redox protein